MHMRVLFASTQSTGHFAPLIPFAQACRDAGHDVLVAGPPPVAELAYRAALRTSPWPPPLPSGWTRCAG